MARTWTGRATSVRERMISRGWTPRTPTIGADESADGGSTSDTAPAKTSTPKKKDNTMLLVGAAAIGLLLMAKK